jgi:hypothetical protein
VIIARKDLFSRDFLFCDCGIYRPVKGLLIR